MIIWNNINGVIGKYKRDEWIGNPNVIESGLTITYDTDSTSATAYILDGSLPPGIRSYTFTEEHKIILHGQIVSDSILKTYKFVIRAENIEGEVDDTYCEIVVDNTTSESGEELGWLTEQKDVPSNKESLTQIEFQFKLNTKIGSQVFTKIEGELPIGLELKENGLLSGVLALVEKRSEYNFTIRCELTGEFEDEIKKLVFDRSFSITVLPLTNMVNPVFINKNERLANVKYLENVNILASAWISPSSIIYYYIDSGELPTGLTLNRDTGYITGTCSEPYEKTFNFVVRAYCPATGGITTKEYSIVSNIQNFLKDTVTPIVGSYLGAFKIGEKVYKEIVIENEENLYIFDTTSFEVIIPKGLSVSQKQVKATEEHGYQSILIISGIVQPQPETTINFEIKWDCGTIHRSGEFSLSILRGLSNELTKLYIELPHNLKQDWLEQYEEFTNYEENIISNTESRIYDSVIYNLYDNIYGFQYIPKIYLRNVSDISYKDLNDKIGSYNYPLEFYLSDLKYTEYIENNKLKCYVIYREVSEVGFDTIKTNESTFVIIDGKRVITKKDKFITSPTFSLLKEKIDSMTTLKDELYPFQDKWNPILIVAYIRPSEDALQDALLILNKTNERFVHKKYVSQYICMESYFENIVKNRIVWFQSYTTNYGGIKDWRDGEYLGNSPRLKLNKKEDWPVSDNYVLVCDEFTEGHSLSEIITEEGSSITTDYQLVIKEEE